MTRTTAAASVAVAALAVVLSASAGGVVAAAADGTSAVAASTAGIPLPLPLPGSSRFRLLDDDDGTTTTGGQRLAILRRHRGEAAAVEARQQQQASRAGGRTRRRSTGGGGGEWMLRERSRVAARYDPAASRSSSLLGRRAGAAVTIADQQYDASYSVGVAFGTPAQTFQVALDTGSADLWVLADTCTSSACEGMSTYDPKYSTSFQNESSSSGADFSIAYGSGSASGTLVRDKVSLGGYSVSSQVFASVDSMSSSLITSPLSGIMGMAFPALASSGATPWWAALASGGGWGSQPMFGVYLARFRDDPTATASEAQGGSLMLGGADASLYTGAISYVSVTGSPALQYWNVPIAALSVQGTSITVGSGANAAAIDTGTTLIGGPAAQVAAIYAAIPGARAMTGSYAGYYEYPCSTSIDLAMTFGTFDVHVTEADFNVGSYGSDTSMCTGGVYVQSLSSSSPIQWVIGDTLLKNVYTVYRYSPAAVGFATLASNSATPSASSSSANSSAASSSAATSAATTARSSSAAATSTTVHALTTIVPIANVSTVAVTATSATTIGAAAESSASSGAQAAASSSSSSSSAPGRHAAVSLGAVALACLAAIVLN